MWTQISKGLWRSDIKPKDVKITDEFVKKIMDNAKDLDKGSQGLILWALDECKRNEKR